MKQSSESSNALANKTILVTGAYGGLGRVAAKTFAEHNATVVLLGRNVDKLEAVYDEIEDAGCPVPAIITMDLETATPEEFQGLADSLYQNFGKLDGIFHSAAVLGVLGPVQTQAPELWKRVMQVNLHAPFLLTRACLPLTLEAPSSSIVFVSDTSANHASAYWGAYGVSKIALESLSKTLAEETENTSIRIRTLLPGPMRTPMRRRTHPGEEAERLRPPEAFADQLVDLMTTDASQTAGLH